MKYQAVIFDLDGVLCDTDHCHYLAWKQISEEIGLFFDQKLNNRLRGVSRMESLEIILKANHKELAGEARHYYAERKNNYYRQFLKSLSPSDVSHEVRSVLDWIQSKGFKLAVGSSSKNAKLVLRQIELEHYFDAISDGTNIIRSKPDPEVFLKASEYIEIPPKDCLVVEDAGAGVKAALAADMDCAAIGNAIQCNLATYNLIHFSDLIPILS